MPPSSWSTLRRADPSAGMARLIHAERAPDFAVAPVADVPVMPKPVYRSYNEFIADPENKKWTQEGELLVLSRHGESICNRVGFLQGMTSTPLVSNGMTPSLRLGETLASLAVSAVYSSPLERAQQTAQFIANGSSHHPIVIDDYDLREINLGLLEWRPDGMTGIELENLFASLAEPQGREAFKQKYRLSDAEVDLIRDSGIRQQALVRKAAAKAGLSEDELVAQMLSGLNDFDYRFPGSGESLRDLDARVRVFASRFNAADHVGATAMVDHGMVNRMLLLALMGIPLTDRSQLKAIPQANSDINVLWRAKGADTWTLLVLDSKSDGN